MQILNIFSITSIYDSNNFIREISNSKILNIPPQGDFDLRSSSGSFGQRGCIHTAEKIGLELGATLSRWSQYGFDHGGHTCPNKQHQGAKQTSRASQGVCESVLRALKRRMWFPASSIILTALRAQLKTGVFKLEPSGTITPLAVDHRKEGIFPNAQRSISERCSSSTLTSTGPVSSAVIDGPATRRLR